MRDGRCQRVVPFVTDDQQIDTELKRYPNAITYLKLHGCIEHTSNASIPLVLSTEQYVRHEAKPKEAVRQVPGLGA